MMDNDKVLRKMLYVAIACGIVVAGILLWSLNHLTSFTDWFFGG